MKPYGGEGCWLLSLLVVVSLASSCYCPAIVQAGSVGLTGTQGKTLIGACARTRMVRASHPGKLRPGQNLDCCLHAPGETLSGVRPCVCCLLAPPCRRRAPSSSSSHGVVIVVASSASLSPSPLSRSIYHLHHFTQQGRTQGRTQDWQRLASEVPGQYPDWRSDDLRVELLRDVEDVTERIQVLLGHAHDEGGPGALGHGLGSWAGVHATISGADFGGVSFQMAAQPMPSLQNARPIRMGP